MPHHYHWDSVRQRMIYHPEVRPEWVERDSPLPTPQYSYPSTSYCVARLQNRSDAQYPWLPARCPNRVAPGRRRYCNRHGQ
jgi:hypothetical protein